MSEALLLGFDIGGTKSAAIVGDFEGRALAREEFATGGPDETISHLVEIGRSLCGGEGPAACGIACGGPLSSRSGTILSPPNLPGWDRIQIVAMVREALGVPAALENNANAAAVAEWRWGLNCELDDVIYLTCGTGRARGWSWAAACSAASRTWPARSATCACARRAPSATTRPAASKG